MLDGDGFPEAHEVFDGNRHDSTTVAEMLAALEKRVGKKAGATVTVDRGMASPKNVAEIRRGGYHYLVAAQQEERWEHEEEFADEAGWEEVVRQPSPTNPFQKKTQVWIKQCLVGEEVRVLCVSEQRKEKDRAIRELQQKRLLADLKGLSRRIGKRRKKPLSEAGKKRRAESAFRAMKSPLMERPIFHLLVHRVETHIFLCVLAYHLLTSVEKTFLDQGIHTSWASLREQLATHQVVTVVLPAGDGQQIRIRKATTPP